MNLGSRLIEAGMVTPQQVEQALEQQRRMGGTLGENLVRLHALSLEQLDKFLTPTAPSLRANDNSIHSGVILNLLLKIMYVHSLKTPADIAHEIKMPQAIIKDMMQRACERQLMESKGALDPRKPTEIYYALSNRGLDIAAEELEKCSYVGPAPVSLSAFNDMVRAQRITDDRIDEASLRRCLSHLVLEDAFFGGLGPIVNSGRSILFYGPSGNGKTAIAMALRNAFRHTIYVPYAVEVDGQIIRIFDPEIHIKVSQPVVETKPSATSAISPKMPDERWVACRRPLAVCSGEMAASMLELTYNSSTKVYEAPVQMKTIGGILLLDDLGRQNSQLAGRMHGWIVQMEHGVEYLLLNTGKKVDVPSNGLVILITDMNPTEILGPNILRRIPYKIHIGSPDKDRYLTIFQNVCHQNGIDYNAPAVESFVQTFYVERNRPMACCHPEFLMRHIILHCRYEGRASTLSYELLMVAAKQIDFIETSSISR